MMPSQRSRWNCLNGCLWLALWGLLAGFPPALFADPPSLLTLKTKDEQLQARLVLLGNSSAWFQLRDGRLQLIRLDKLRNVVRRDEPFEPLGMAAMRNDLRREFGRGLEVVGSKHYLVVARSSIAQGCTRILEVTYGSFSRYLSTRGLKLDQTEFPLVVVVLPDRAAFVKYCQQTTITPASGLRGFYEPQSNRVILYETSRDRSQGLQPLSGYAASGTSWGSTAMPGTGGLSETLVHESIHQLAFNRGLHQRIGQNPRWLVEGLAMVLESPGIMEGLRDASRTVNYSRLTWFQTYRKKSSQPISIETMVSDPTLFSRRTLDAYSEAWAWTYFLLDTRSSKFSSYLRRIEQRDQAKSYSPQERLSDFREEFGDDLESLQKSFDRYMSDLVRQTLTRR